jgi:hypothetical protein
MRNLRGTSRSQKLAGEVQMARIRLARAESELKSSEEEWRLARRRRKEAKQAARRAKRNFKHAKAGVAEAHQFLAETRTKLFKAGEHLSTAARKTRRPTRKKLIARAAARPGKHATRARQSRGGQLSKARASSAKIRMVRASSRPPSAVLPRRTGRLLRSKPASKSAPSVPAAAQEIRKPIHVPRDFEVTPEIGAPLTPGRTVPAPPQL